jgi:hypothetical protein
MLVYLSEYPLAAAALFGHLDGDHLNGHVTVAMATKA